MRGHCEIRLHNKETHTYKKIDADNLVTNAWKYMLSYQAMAESTGSNTFPIAENILGGLMLFDGSLTENAENVCFPHGAHLVGYGDRSADAADPMRGTYNLLESGPWDQGYTHVWDFSTAQCNKTISAISLTGVRAADLRLRLGCPVYSSGGPDFSYWSRGNYHDGEYSYQFRAYSNKLELYRWPVPCGAIKVSTRFNYNNGDITMQEYVKTIHDYTSDPTTIGGDWVYSSSGYFVRASLTWRSTSSGYRNVLTYEKVTLPDWTYEPLVLVTIDGILNELSDWGWAGDYYYAYKSDTKTIYRIDPENIADIRTFTFDPKYTNILWRGCHSNGILSVDLYDNEKTGSNKYVGAMIYPDGEVVIFGYYHGSSSYSIKAQCGHSDVLYVQQDNFIDQYCYLGTICNLSSPVTKTSATTMKVIYTLTDV